MSRSARRLAVALGPLAVLSIIVGACGAASAPALTDPREIVTAALRSTESAKSVHIEMTLDGKVSAPSTGAGAPGPTIALTGTTASADVDIAAGSAHASFSVPAFLGLTGDLIQIGGTSYYKTSMTGDMYQSQTSANLLPVVPIPAGSGSLVGTVDEFLSRPGVDPVKGDDVACGSTQCYTVQIELTSDELIAMGADAATASGLPLDLGAASLNLAIRVEKDTNHLAGFAATVALGEQGSLTIDMAMSKWDQPVTISAPPADQVQPGS
jgi:hypothetical protein